VDYLVTLPEVEKDKIGPDRALTGGKQALVAAAFGRSHRGGDFPRAGNTGECGPPGGYTTDMFVNESIQLLTAGQPHWFHPRLRFFSGAGKTSCPWTRIC